MGVLLVNRGSRFRLHAGGRAVLDWARRIVGTAPCGRLNALRDGLTGGCGSPRSRPRSRWWRAHHALSRAPSQRAVHDLVAHSIEVLTQLENLEIDAGITYLDNEPLGRVNAVPLYRERYRLLTSADAPLGNRAAVTWAEVAQVPLCLLTPDMQNRRIIDGLLRAAAERRSRRWNRNSMIVLFAHVRTGRWASVMPAKLAETLGLTETIRAIPIVEPEAVHTIGLVVPSREPMTPSRGAVPRRSASRGDRRARPTERRRTSRGADGDGP